MLSQTLFILILLFSVNGFSKIEYPKWHCAVDLELRGDSSNAYENGKDAFVGSQNISCYNYAQNKSYASKNAYEFRLTGVLKTGFNSSDFINLRMTQFLAEDPEDFAQSTYNLTIYSELPFGDKISFYLIARSTETQKISLLSIMAPVSLANNLRDFFSNDVQFSMRRIQSQNVVQ